MKAKINGYDCELTVAEFKELTANPKPETVNVDEVQTLPARHCPVPDLEIEDRDELGGLKKVIALKRPGLGYTYFARISDLLIYFKELTGAALTGFAATWDTPRAYIRKQAEKLWARLNPENRFEELVRYTTTGKCLTAKMDGNGKCIDVEISEPA